MSLKDKFAETTSRVQKEKQEKLLQPLTTVVVDKIIQHLCRTAEEGLFEAVFRPSNARQLEILDEFCLLLQSRSLRNKLSEQLDGVLVILCATSYDPYLIFSWKPGSGKQTRVEDYTRSPDKILFPKWRR